VNQIISKLTVMKNIIAFMGFFLLVSTEAFSYPISPRPLRKLIIESEYIIYGFVLETGRVKVDRSNKKVREVDYWQSSDYALIVIREQWQGKAITDTVKVYYTAGMICPAPPDYTKGTEIVAFLDKIKDSKNGYSTHALSYGVKLITDPAGLQVYKNRIKEMQQILTLSESDKKDKLILDWLVACAENKTTRWEGAYELSPESDFMSSYEQDASYRKYSYLNNDQKQRLFKALKESDPLTYTDLSLVDMCTGINDELVLELLKSRLVSMKEEECWQSDYFMHRIVYLTGDTELERLFKEYSDYSYFNNDGLKKRKELLQLFIKKMKTARVKQLVYASGESDA